MKQLVKKHSLAMRWFHWVNFPILTIMIWSGMLIYWANDVYKISVGNTTVIKFFPEWFYKALNIPFRLGEGMGYHFAFMWLFIINGILYFLYTTISGEWREVVPNRKSFKEAFLVLLHDLRLRKSAPPQKKYNAAQKIAYTSIILMGAGSTITGFAIYKPVQLGWLCWLCGGYEAARVEHFALTIGFSLFFLVHIIQVIKTGWNNFQSVVTGFEIKANHTPQPPASHSSTAGRPEEGAPSAQNQQQQ